MTTLTLTAERHAGSIGPSPLLRSMPESVKPRLADLGAIRAWWIRLARRAEAATTRSVVFVGDALSRGGAIATW